MAEAEVQADLLDELPWMVSAMKQADKKLAVEGARRLQALGLPHSLVGVLRLGLKFVVTASDEDLKRGEL